MDDKKKKLELDQESIANLTGTGGGKGGSAATSHRVDLTVSVDSLGPVGEIPKGDPTSMPKVVDSTTKLP